MRSTYFFYYNKGENVVYDLTYETREKMSNPQAISVQRLSQEPQHELSKKNPQLQLQLDEITSLSAIGLVTSLANGIEVPQGTVVAHGRIEGNNGIIEAFDIVAGQDTAEWAIRFPNVQNIVKHHRPQAYRAWTVQQPDGMITVAQNYLKSITFQTPVVPAKLSLELVTASHLPSNLTLDVNRIIFYLHQEIGVKSLDDQPANTVTLP